MSNPSSSSTSLVDSPPSPHAPIPPHSPTDTTPNDPQPSQPAIITLALSFVHYIAFTILWLFGLARNVCRFIASILLAWSAPITNAFGVKALPTLPPRKERPQPTNKPRRDTSVPATRKITSIQTSTTAISRPQPKRRSITILPPVQRTSSSDAIFFSQDVTQSDRECQPTPVHRHTIEESMTDSEFLPRRRDPRRIDHSSRRILFNNATPRPRTVSRVPIPPTPLLEPLEPEAPVPELSAPEEVSTSQPEVTTTTEEPRSVFIEQLTTEPVALDHPAHKGPSWKKLIPSRGSKSSTTGSGDEHSGPSLQPRSTQDDAAGKNCPRKSSGLRRVFRSNSTANPAPPISTPNPVTLRSTAVSDSEGMESKAPKPRKLRRRSTSSTPTTPSPCPTTMITTPTTSQPVVTKSLTRTSTDSEQANSPDDVTKQQQQHSAKLSKSRFRPFRDFEAHLYNAGIGSGPNTKDAWELCTTPIPKGGIPRTRYDQFGVISSENRPLPAKRASGSSVETLALPTPTSDFRMKPTRRNTQTL